MKSAVFSAVLLVSCAQAGLAQETLKTRTIRMPVRAAAATTGSVPMWTGNDGGYSYTMVGQSPLTALSSPTTTITVPILPVALTFPDGTTLDPTAVDSVCSPAGSALSLLEQSPIFNNFAYTVGGATVGDTEYHDFFQRANFWKYTAPSGVNPDYHMALSASPHAVTTIAVPAADGSTIAAGCGRLGEVNLQWFDDYLQNTVFPAAGVSPTEFVVVLLYNSAIYETGDPALILGYHSAFASTGGALQTYAVGHFDTTGSFGTIEDVADLSHEMGEWMDDPLGNNPTPPWGNIGEVSGCKSTLEVGDPLSGTDLAITMPNSYVYHLQELAFVSWYFRDAPSMGVNGWYSSNGTFRTPATECAGGTTATTTNLTLSATSVTAGTQVNFTAAVTPAGATGSVTLSTGSGTLGPYALTNGIASGVITLPAGTYTLTAEYGGGSTFAASSSSSVALTVNGSQATVTTLTASPTAIPSGGQVTIAINVTPAAATGMVTLVSSVAGTIISLPLASGAVNGSISLPRGTYTITAEYQGDTTYAASNSAPVTINPMALQSTVTTLSLTSAVAGGSTTASVQVTPATATGTVTLISSTGSTLAKLTLTNGAASATFTLPAGTYTVTAQYSGDATDAASSSTPVSTTPPAPTVTTLLLTSAVAGGNTTASVQVSPASATGTVTLVSSTGSTLAKLTLTNGAASGTLTLPAGTYSVTAQYSGDATHAASASAPVAISPPAPTVTALSLSSTASGGLASASVHVSPASATGTVTITSSATGTLGGLSLVGGAASGVFDLPPGTYALTAAYSGDTAFAASTSVAVTVSPQLKLSTTSLSFGGAQTLTISNTSATNALVLIGAAGKDPADFSWTRGCPLFLLPGKSCSIQVQFAPLASGIRTAALLVGGFVEAFRQTVSLTGGP